ncbi:VWA domain-containing protein [Granulosicoccus sp. 3-233]|uniref:VWA domain-containing protein n=1 Tax=Granulosicoccus sp. 3-233 TaxID=3417969 RepID=UPI003D33979A
MIHFSWPWIFLLLPLPWLLQRLRTRPALTAIDIPPSMEEALQSLPMQTRSGANVRQRLAWICWIALLSAIAQPWIPTDAVIQPASGRAIALAVDVSGSMDRQDFSLDGEISDRLSIVKQVATDFMARRSGDRLSLVLYGKEAFIASPLTFDLHALSNILDSAGIGMAGRSTAIGDAIGLSIKTLQADPAEQKAIVLLSDGTNNAGSVEPESAAELANELNIRIHSIALGSIDGERGGYQTAQSADLDEETLARIAELAGGEFFRASSTADLQQVYSAIDRLESAEAAAPPVILRHDLRLWPQILLLFCLLLLALDATMLERIRQRTGGPIRWISRERARETPARQSRLHRTPGSLLRQRFSR